MRSTRPSFVVVFAIACAAACLGGDRALAGFVFSLPDDLQPVVSTADRLDPATIDNPGLVCSAYDRSDDRDSPDPLSGPAAGGYSFLKMVGQLPGDGGPENGRQRDSGGDSRHSDSDLAPSTAAASPSPRAKSGRMSLDQVLILFPPLASRYFRPPRRFEMLDQQACARAIADRAAAWRAPG